MGRTPQSYHTERAGVYAVAKIVHEELRWIFREIKEDVGIDAHVEVVADGVATGKLIAVQIKSGASYFARQDAIGFVFRGELKHLDYWLTTTFQSLSCFTILKRKLPAGKPSLQSTSSARPKAGRCPFPAHRYWGQHRQIDLARSHPDSNESKKSLKNSNVRIAALRLVIAVVSGQVLNTTDCTRYSSAAITHSMVTSSGRAPRTLDFLGLRITRCNSTQAVAVGYALQCPKPTWLED